MEETHQYGVVATGRDHGHSFRDYRHGRKTAKRNCAPSNLIISGRYILGPEIFDILEKGEKGAGGRNPAHRRHEGARKNADLFMGFASTGAPMTAA